MMPVGLINQLSDENEFFDLVSYLVELGKAGTAGAVSLKSDDAAGLALPSNFKAYIGKGYVYSEKNAGKTKATAEPTQPPASVR